MVTPLNAEQPRHCPTVCLLLLLILAHFAEIPSEAQVSHTRNLGYRRVARTGEAGLQSIEGTPSINNLGDVSFVARAGTTLRDGSVYIHQGGSLRKIGLTRQYSRFQQVNDHGFVVAQDTGSAGNTVKTFVRLWPSVPGNMLTRVAEAGVQESVDGWAWIFDPTIYPECAPESRLYAGDFFCDFENLAPIYLQSHFLEFDVVYAPSINNSNEVAYAATGGLAGHLTSSILFRRTVINELGALAEDAQLVLRIGGSTIPFRPQLADDRKLIARAGPSATDPIILWLDAADSRSGRVLAGKRKGFQRMGQSPGISDNGGAVAFAGEHEDMAGGSVWVVPTVPDSVHLAVFGTEMSRFDPGESAWVIRGGNPPRAMRLSTPEESDQALRFEGLELDDKIAVNALSPHNEYRVLLTANCRPWDSATATQAVITTVLGAKRDTLGRPLLPQQFEILVPPYILAQAGQANWETTPISNFRLADGINTNGDIAILTQHPDGVSRVGVASILFDPLRQTQIPWATNDYAPDRFGAFVDSIDADEAHPQRDYLPQFQHIQENHLNNISGKGCVLTSLAIGANLLHEGSTNLWTPLRLHRALEQHENGFTPIQGVYTSPDGTVQVASATGLPLFYGQDANEVAYCPILGIRAPMHAKGTAQTQSNFLVEIWNYLMNDEQPRVTMVERSGHRFILAGVTHANSRRVYLIDPYVNRLGDHRIKDKVFEYDDQGSFLTALAGIGVTYRRLEKESSSAVSHHAKLLPQLRTLLVTSSPGVEFQVKLGDGRKIGFNPADGQAEGDGNSAYGVRFPIIDPESEITSADSDEIAAQAPRSAEVRGVEDAAVEIVVTSPVERSFDLTSVWWDPNQGESQTARIQGRTSPNGETTVWIRRPSGGEGGAGPPRIAGLSRLPSGLDIIIEGVAGQAYAVEVSSNLSEWRLLRIVTIPTGATRGVFALPLPEDLHAFLRLRLATAE